MKILLYISYDVPQIVIKFIIFLENKILEINKAKHYVFLLPPPFLDEIVVVEIIILIVVIT